MRIQARKKGLVNWEVIIMYNDQVFGMDWPILSLLPPHPAIVVRHFKNHFNDFWWQIEEVKPTKKIKDRKQMPLLTFAN